MLNTSHRIPKSARSYFFGGRVTRAEKHSNALFELGRLKYSVGVATKGKPQPAQFIDLTHGKWNGSLSRKETPETSLINQVAHRTGVLDESSEEVPSVKKSVRKAANRTSKALRGDQALNQAMADAAYSNDENSVTTTNDEKNPGRTNRTAVRPLDKSQWGTKSKAERTVKNFNQQADAANELAAKVGKATGKVASGNKKLAAAVGEATKATKDLTKVLKTKAAPKKPRAKKVKES